MNDSLVDGDVILSGWGSISPSGGTMPDTLQKVTLPIVDLETCRKAIESLTGDAPLHPNNVCTGPLTGGVSACSVRLFSVLYLFGNVEKCIVIF